MQFATEPNNVENVLLLDDAVIWGALSMMADATDTTVSQFAVSLRDRRLYKCADLRTQLAEY